MKLQFDLNQEGVNNDRIQEHLNSFTDIKERNDYCGSIIDKKKLLLRLHNQTKQLGLPFDYDLETGLKNLDLIEADVLHAEIKRNLAYWRRKAKQGSLTTRPADDTRLTQTARKWRQWVRIISTPM